MHDDDLVSFFGLELPNDLGDMGLPDEPHCGPGIACPPFLAFDRGSQGRQGVRISGQQPTGEACS